MADAQDRPPGGARQAREEDLARKVALLTDKLANAEDEYAALYAKALKSDAKEQERVARHHKVVGQLQKKVLAEAEIKRQLQRKLDSKDAPLAAALGEKEAVWAAEREAMQTQIRSLEDQKWQVGEELDRKDVQLQRLETSLIDMNERMQELEKSAAHWKNTAEKRQAQVSDAVAAQRSSDSRVVVLQAENARRRDENKALREQLPVQTPSADVQTQTENCGSSPVGAPESRRREGEEWAYLMQMLMQTCADASSAVQSTRQLSAALLAEAYSARETACVDANTSRKARAVYHIAVGTDSARHAQSVHVQTQELGNERSQAGVQTVPEIRVTRYHFDSQTDPVVCSKSVHAIMQTEGVVLTTRAHSDAAARRLVDLESELAEHAAQKRGLENELQIARGKQQSQEQQIFALESGLESLRAVTHQQASTHQAHRDQAKKELAVLQHELADHAMRRQILEEELQVAAQTRQMQENQIRFLTRDIETMGAAVKQQVSTKSPARIHVATATSPRASPRSQMLEDALRSSNQANCEQEQQIRVLTEELEATEAASRQHTSWRETRSCDVATSTSLPSSPEPPSAPVREENVVLLADASQSTTTLEGAAATWSDMEHRDERWWRRSPLKATSSIFSPDAARTPGTPSETAHTLPLKMDVQGLEKESERRVEVATVMGGGGGMGKPVSPDAMGSGTPHPQPGLRRHLAGTPSIMRGLIPPASVQLQWPLGKQQAGAGVNATLSPAAVREASLKRPQFRAGEGPLQVRLPTSPGPSVHGTEELKRAPIAFLQHELDRTHSADASVFQRAADRAVHVANAVSSSGRPENGVGAEAPTFPGAHASEQCRALLNVTPHNTVSESHIGQGRVDDSVRVSLPIQDVESPTLMFVTVERDRARLQSSIAALHSVEAALLAGRTDRLTSGCQDADAASVQPPHLVESETPPFEPEALPAEESAAVKGLTLMPMTVVAHSAKSEDPEQKNATVDAELIGAEEMAPAGPRRHASSSSGSTAANLVPMASTIGAAPVVTVADADAQQTSQPRVLRVLRPAAAEPGEAVETEGIKERVIVDKDGRQTADTQREHGQPETSLPSHYGAQKVPTHHIRLISEGAEDTTLVNNLDGDAGGRSSLSHASLTPSTPSPSESIPVEGDDNEQALRAQGKTGKRSLDAKWLFGSPRDAVSLLTDSPLGSLRIRAVTSMPLMALPTAGPGVESRAGPRMTQSGTHPPQDSARRASTPESDSSDDETWNGFVQRGLRPRLHRSLLDEAAGLKKTLTHALANDVASPSRSAHFDMVSAHHDDKAKLKEETLSSGHQMQSLQRRLQRPRLASSGDSSTLGFDSADAQSDLNGLLDEVRRATDRCERRKRMIKLLDGKSSDQEQSAGKDQDKLLSRQDVTFMHSARTGPWSRRKSARSIQDKRDWRHDPDHGRVHRRKNVLNHRFGEVRVSTSPATELTTTDHDREGYGLRRPGSNVQSLSRALAGSPKMNEMLMIESGDSSVRWSPIKPSQMAVLRSFLTNLDDSPI
jgi:hypothetical protein